MQILDERASFNPIGGGVWDLRTHQRSTSARKWNRNRILEWIDINGIDTRATHLKTLWSRKRYQNLSREGAMSGLAPVVARNPHESGAHGGKGIVAGGHEGEKSIGAVRDARLLQTHSGGLRKR